MQIHILTLFPEMFAGPFSESILKRAQEKGIFNIRLHQLRDYALDKHQTVDDTPYGGGKGMVLKVDIIDRALEDIKNQISKNSKSSPKTFLLTPQGKRYCQDKAIELSKYESIILICGHYEGFDERIRGLVDEEISLGDFVLTGGEIPAMAIVDSVARLLPGVISEESPDEESFMQKDESGNYLLEYPQYTRPVEFKGKKVPDVLLSGNHAEIAKWRKENSKKADEV